MCFRSMISLVALFSLVWACGKPSDTDSSSKTTENQAATTVVAADESESQEQPESEAPTPEASTQPESRPTSEAAAETAATPDPKPSRTKSPRGQRMEKAGETMTWEIQFGQGQSAAEISDSVLRGERHRYLVDVANTQQLYVSISALEDNAVFNLKDPNGDFVDGASDMDDARYVMSNVFTAGEHIIEVGGTRGNATYRLFVGAVDNYSMIAMRDSVSLSDEDWNALQELLRSEPNLPVMVPTETGAIQTVTATVDSQGYAISVSNAGDGFVFDSRLSDAAPQNVEFGEEAGVCMHPIMGAIPINVQGESDWFQLPYVSALGLSDPASEQRTAWHRFMGSYPVDELVTFCESFKEVLSDEVG